MKKVLLALSILMLLICFCACGSNDPAPVSQPPPQDNAAESPPAETPTPPPARTNFTLGGGPQGGNWYGLVGQLASELEGAMSGMKFSVMPGGGIGNVDLTENGEMDIATTASHLYRSALDGVDPYAGHTYENLTALAEIGTSDTCLFIVKASLPINSLQELIDQKYPIRLVTTTKASTPSLGAERILAEFGVTIADLESWGGSMSYLSYTDGCQLIADGHADGIIAPMVAAITELEANTALKLLPLDEATVDSLVSQFGYSKNYVKAETYSFATEDFWAIGEPNILLCRKDVPDEVAYTAVKLICENPDLIRSWGSYHANFMPENAPFNVGGPLHPGAEKYYKEAGFLK